MRRMIHEHLQRRAMVAPPMLSAAHLDEDALSAFLEGRLSESEAVPVTSHLVYCGFCRRITAQLVRLESELGESEITTIAGPEEPGRIRRLLQDLAARVLPAADDDAAVFAYHAPAEDFKRKEEPGESEAVDKAKSEAGEESAPETPEK